MKEEYQKLGRKELFDVYGISILSTKPVIDKSWLLVLLLPIAEKYVNITMHAMKVELRHFPHGVELSHVCGNEQYNLYLKDNLRLLKILGIKNWKKDRLKLSIENIIKIFERGNWHVEYGGAAWYKIAIGCLTLQKAIKEKRLEKILAAIDRLNDLEHNNAKYLEDHCNTSCSYEYLCEIKSEASEADLISECSSEIKKLYGEAMR